MYEIYINIPNVLCRRRYSFNKKKILQVLECDKSISRYKYRVEYGMTPDKALMVFKSFKFLRIFLAIILQGENFLQHTAKIGWSLHNISVRISDNPLTENFHQDVRIIPINLMSAA